MVSGLHERVLEYIKVFSKENPVRSSMIEISFNLSGTEVRDVIRELRRTGIPICAISDRKNNRGGYFYSENPQDVLEMKQDLKNRISSMQNTLAQFDFNYKGDKQLTF